MSRCRCALAVLLGLFSCSAVFAQAPSPTMLIENAQTRIVRVDILANSTRSMHSHDDMLWHVFVTMDAPAAR